MTQLSFLGPALSHRKDASTSKQAGVAVDRSGKRADNCSKVLGFVKQSPGQTSGELSAAYSFDLTELRRRLTDLLNRGWITNTEPGTTRTVEECARACTAKGTRQKCWWATGRAPQ